MKIVTFGTLKGGVGKTMLTFHIGGILSQQKKKVLLIDSDLQGNLTNNIGVDRTRQGIPTLYDVYNIDSERIPPESLVIKNPNPALSGLDIIAGSIFLHKAELKISTVAGREQILKYYMEDYHDFFSKYDYILIDTNPSMSIVNQNAFLISDVILLVSDVSMNALEGAQLFIALWEETRQRLRVSDNIKGLIINDFDSRNKLSGDFLEFLQTTPDLADLQALALNTIIPRTVRITESELASQPVSLYDRNSKGCAAITALIAEMKKKKIL